ncbi:hypothetical protein P4489_06680 [Heyndrickxia sporothermodurans]|uniref:hypothetical protein n=1 Tax=Heyndrickxia sporothermodurans TaxID=46224 RepID=UPI002E1AAD09|nr:hypothetical protein [Heyndrickxia sporothermodurans]
MEQQVKELREKAFAGDKEALEMYNTYVDRGQAPRLDFGKKASSFNMADAYKNNQKDNAAGFDNSEDFKRLREMNASPYMLMAAGYAARKEQKEHVEGDVINFAGEKIEHELSPLQKMMNGYNPDFTQKEKEVTVNPNDITKED